ncbi:MAG: DUF4438 domain-containing protein [Erysipelotrichaceae bacterium]
MKTNKTKLVKQAVAGKIHHPTMQGSLYRVGFDGQGRYVHGTGSITYNFSIGDSCMELMGDHVEPGVSIRNENSNENNALIGLACVGNEAVVVSGDAKGAKGTVVGKHGGVDHTMIHFTPEVLDKLNINDTIQIKAYGNGLRFLDLDTKILNLDPALLEQILAHVPQVENKLHIPVTHIIPAHLMGSGLGSSNAASDYDIMTQDAEANAALGLETLRFGDLVAIENHNNNYGPHYQAGAISIGVIVHSDSFTSGHGPGVCVILSGTSDEITLVKDETANLERWIVCNS